jgi:L-aminopeptidase/D-esterase-like protein
MPPGFGPLPGLRVGHAQDADTRTGCTVLLAAQGAVAAALVLGGAAGERELQTLHPSHLVERIDALLFAGGSAFGLDAAGGVMRWCAEHEIGFDTGIARVPIVPAAILFDLRLAAARRPDAAMGYAAAQAAAQASSTTGENSSVAEGNVGAGAGCTVGKLFGLSRAMKSGIGCWTERLPAYQGREPDTKSHPDSNADSHRDSNNDSQGATVAALAAVNAFGDVLDPTTGRILAGTRTSPSPSDVSRDFVNTAAAIRNGAAPARFGHPSASSIDIATPSGDSGSPSNTVLVAVVTDAILTRAEAGRVAQMAAAGMARTLSPAHTTFDGDIIFVLSVGQARANLNALGIASAEAVAHAIVRGVTQSHSAHGVPGLAGTTP